jgi:hypothetical protein
MKHLFSNSVGYGLVGSVVIALLGLSALAAAAASPGTPVVRDHRGQPPAANSPGTPVVRDHRGEAAGQNGGTPADVRDHRTKDDPVLQAALAKAVNAALKGPEIKGLKVAGHDFNVKKASITGNSKLATIKGQISHRLTLRPDDQVYYTIQKSGSKVTSAHIQIKRGGLTSLINYPGKRLQSLVGIGIVLDPGFESLLRAWGGNADGAWESSAELIVSAVAVGYRAPRPRDTARPGHTPPPARATSSASGPAIRDHRSK